MNKLIAEVTEIKSVDRINLIKFRLNTQTVNALILEMNLNLNVGDTAELSVKSTAISVAENFCEFENVLKGRVLSVKKGEVLASVLTDVEGFEMEAVSLKENVNVNGDVFLFFKANDVSIVKVLNV